MSLLFVYGTLMKKCKPNEWSAYLQENATYVGEASVKGKLYRIDFYPGLVKGEGTVYGEVYKLHEPALILPTLDEYEDYRPDALTDSLYLRENTEVTLLHNGEKKKCLIYYFNRPTDTYPEITSGRFTP
ncbi:gamma-glutamylcyclotransferase family protein [uncultured Arcticibacterium sp.]|uniref:gamma-glutamylcyclotransferase family protein n=1 Tax=uncultured Arcticibacterium sp. TaxID=2173042 RepID=UPI0030F681D5